MSDTVDTHDPLMPLDRAASLAVLGGNFSPRDLRRYAARPRLPLPAIRPGREYLTRESWVADWIEGLRTCRDPASLLTRSGAKIAGAGASSTGVTAPRSSRVSPLRDRLTKKPPSSRSRDTSSSRPTGPSPKPPRGPAPPRT